MAVESPMGGVTEVTCRDGRTIRLEVGRALRVIVATTDAVALTGIPSQSPSRCLIRRQIEYQCSIWQQATAAKCMQRHDFGVAHTQRKSLISATAVDEAIAQHPFFLL